MENLLSILLGLSLFIAKLSQGLNITIRDLSYLQTKPRLLRRSLLAVDILVPLASYLIVILFPLPLEISTTILLVAACPGSPLTTRKVLQKRGILAYGASLHLVVILASIITTPITIWFFFVYSQLSVQVNILDIIKQIFTAQLLPLILGLFISNKFSDLADKIRNPLTKISDYAILGVTLIVVTITFRFVLEINLISLIAIILTVSTYLVIGHLMGGRHPQRRHTLALVCTSRNVGLAAFIASLNFPITLILPNIIPYLFLSAIVEIIYIRIIKI